MLNFGLLSRLDSHNEWLHPQLQTKDFRLVGGVVRDLLLGIDTPLIDIDITGPHHPDQRRARMKSDTGVSRFRTEKFGTMTMVREIKTENIENYQDDVIESEIKGSGAIHKKPLLIGVIGTIGSGKTTVAEYLHQQTGYPRLQVDKIRRELFGEKIDFSPEQYDVVKKYVASMIEYLLSQGKSVIFDRPCGTDEHRIGYLTIAQRHDADLKLIQVTTDDTKIRQRILTREPNGNNYSGAKVDVFDRFVDLWQPLSQQIKTHVSIIANDGIREELLQQVDGLIEDFNQMDCFIPRKDEKENRGQTISYEITPFRCEGDYEDFRHPGEIQWSDNLLDDARRRDFTINCLYYKRVNEGTNERVSAGGKDNSQQHNAPDLNTEFDSELYLRQGYRYDEDSGTLCVCNHELIQEAIKRVNGKNSEQSNLSKISPTRISLDSKHLILDPYQGLVDLVHGTLRCVGDADHRLQEDALRILRALRFVNTLNQTSQIQWDFHRDTRRSMQKYHFLVQHLAKERIHQELVKVFKMNNPFGYVALLDELKLLPLIFPALAAIKGLEQPVRYHPLDTYHHTLMTLWHLQKINANYIVKLAMLYHDVGKSQQYKLYNIGLTREEMGIVHGSWLNHTVCGPDFVRKDFAALGFSRDEIDQIARLVQYHMYPGQILMSTPDNQVKKLRKLLTESSYKQMCDLLDVMEGDRLGHYNPLQSQAELDGPAQMRSMLDQIYHDEGQITMLSLEIDGTVLMSELKLAPSKIIGKLLQKCLDYVLIDPQRNTRKELLNFAKKECKKLESSISSQ